MAGTNDRYGALAKPEERAPIEVVENPVALAHAAYKAWLPIARARPFAVDLPTRAYGQGLSCQLYDEAARLLRPAARAFDTLTQDQLDSILAAAKPADSEATGLFVSALLSETGLPGLDGGFSHQIVGYRLAAGKKLVLRGTGAYGAILDAGRHASGTLINCGDTWTFARQAAGGLQVNYGSVYHELADGARGGLQANLGSGKIIAYQACGGVQVNYGPVKDGGTIGYQASGGVQMECGPTYNWIDRLPPRDPRRNHFNALELKLIQLKHLYMGDEPVTGVRLVKPDPERQKLEDEITALGKKIEEVVR
jgi:hypothetical protein